jgi:hypothetical protein
MRIVFSYYEENFWFSLLVFILFLVCAFICHRSDPFSSVLSFGHHRPSGAQDSSPACLVPDLACSDFLGSKIFHWDRLDLSSGPIFFCHCFSRARIGLWIRSLLGSPFVWFPRLTQATIPRFSFFYCNFLFPLRSLLLRWFLFLPWLWCDQASDLIPVALDLR